MPIPENTHIFRYNEAAGISSLDPAFARDQANIWAVNQIFNGLVQLDNELNIKPCIAKSWIISADGLTYTFFLRQDVRFHSSWLISENNAIVKAEDFVYSFNRIMDPDVASPGRWIFQYVAMDERGNYAFDALNDTTFQITLKKAFAPFLGMLAMQYCSVVPSEVVDFYDKDFRRNPIGTGPFIYKFWKEGVKLVLVKNPDYFEMDSLGIRLPYLDAVSVSFIQEKHTSFMEFMDGKLDFISGVDPAYKDVLVDINGNLKPEHNGKINMLKSPYLNTEYLGILVDPNADGAISIMQQKLIRQAINVGFDRRKMIRYMRNSLGYPGLFGMIPPGLAGFYADSSFSSEYNPAMTAALLKQAGFPGGKGLPPIKLLTTSSYADLCQFIQNQLLQSGISVSLEVIPPSTLREWTYQSKAGFFRASWIADYPDAENYLSLFASNNWVPNGPNYTHFSSSMYDTLYNQSLKENNLEVRTQLYREMNAIIQQECPVIVLYYDMAVRFVRPEVSGMQPNPLNLLVLKNVRKID